MALTFKQLQAKRAKLDAEIKRQEELAKLKPDARTGAAKTAKSTARRILDNERSRAAARKKKSKK